MSSQTLTRRTDEILVRDHFSACATRERGRRFYATLVDRVQSADDAEVLVVSFAGVEFVSPSFLDEAIVRLLEERPELCGRIRVTGLHPIAEAKLRAALQATGIEPAGRAD